MSVTYQLPWPPSVNTYWRHVGSRVLVSEAGRVYRKDVAAAVLSSGRKAFGSARLHVQIAAYPPDNRRRDLDNLLKAVLDSLQYVGAFFDDSQIDRLDILRCGNEPEGMIVVNITALEAQP